MKVSMDENFKKLENRVLEALSETDFFEIKSILSSLKEATLVSGVGGSSVVSFFLAKVLSAKNNIICENVRARDLNYRSLDCFKNVISCSYSGNNFGVTTAFNNDLDKYLFSKRRVDGVNNVNYSVGDVENSFISLSATLIPMSVALSYYLDNDIDIIKEILSSRYEFNFNDSNIYEVLSGYETGTADKFIESTFTEAGIGMAIIHDKYDYCHGRSTLGFNYNSNLIFFDTGSELDQLYDDVLRDYYQDVIRLARKYDDDIVNDYYFTYLSMYLCRKIAQMKGKDLSVVEYSPLVKKLYYYKGGM